ncbi:MAG: exosortase C-terminal domain/associated protein EpsI [Verrucomicrobiia bacterium]
MDAKTDIEKVEVEGEAAGLNPNAAPLARVVEVPWWRGFVALAACGLTVLVCQMTPEVNSSPEAGVRMELPVGLGRFVSVEGEVSRAERMLLPDDTEFARRIYISPTGDEILCSIVLSGGERRSIHRPEVCLPGQGWTIKTQETVPVPLHNGQTLRVTNLVLEREVQVGPNDRRKIESFYMYWFVGRDVVTHSHWERVLMSSWDRLTRNLNHRWAYVIVSSNIGSTIRPGGRSPEETREMMKQFIADIVPTFQKIGLEKP